MIKIGVLSDTHIPKAANALPDEVVKAFHGVDLILHAGDLAEISVYEDLKKIAPCHAVYGNMDNLQVRDVLPQKTVVKAGKFKIGLIHGYGAPKSLKDYVRGEFDKNIDAIVFGHSHMPCNEISGKTLFFNPGSPTDNVYAPYRSYGILTVSDGIKGEIIKI